MTGEKNSMKAVVLHGFGGTEKLILEETPVPVITNEEVLVKVKSVAINPIDVKTRSGKGLYGMLKDEKPLILGWDLSGTIAETGKSVTAFRKGDEVFGMVNFPGHGRCYAGYTAAPATHLSLKPANISHDEAAAASLAALTAWQALKAHAPVQKGQRVLIQAAAGGVGHFAVQIAKYFGAWVAGTASASNRDFVLGLGADEHIDYKAGALEEQVSDIDFVLDTIGGDSIDDALKVMKKGSAIVSIPSGLNEAVGEKAAAKEMNGYTFKVRSNGSDMKEIANLLQKAIVKPHVSRIFLFHEMAKAHAQIETGRTRGKVVVQV